MAFPDYLLSLCMLSSFFHVVVCMYQHLLLPYDYCSLYDYYTFCLSMSSDRHLCCFHILDIMNNAMNMCIYTFTLRLLLCKMRIFPNGYPDILIPLLKSSSLPQCYEIPPLLFPLVPWFVSGLSIP